MKRKVLVCGGVDFNNEALLAETLDAILEKENTVIVSGGAKGADTLAEKYAADNGIEIKVFPAEWSKYGRSAGPIRNKKMLDFISGSGNPLVVAFWNGKSRGTKNTIETARKMEIATLVADYKEEE
ncbi:MAG: DUF2493 domain-containing protein [Clostridia bacterium]|nr:DUF2493 domain-containing protein [Clostridia bacterium]